MRTLRHRRFFNQKSVVPLNGQCGVWPLLIFHNSCGRNDSLRNNHTTQRHCHRQHNNFPSHISPIHLLTDSDYSLDYERIIDRGPESTIAWSKYCNATVNHSTYLARTDAVLRNHETRMSMISMCNVDSKLFQPSRPMFSYSALW